MTQVTESGFLLTRHQYDRNGYCCFELWVKTASGVKQLIVENERPVCFVKTEDVPVITELLTTNRISFESGELNLTSFEEENMTALYCVSLRDYQALRKLAEAQKVELFEDDIKPVDRYLMERFIQGNLLFTGKQIAANVEKFSDVKIKTSHYSTDLTHLSIDIECDEKGNLYSIGMYSCQVDGSGDFSLVLYNLEWVLEKPSNDSPDFIEWCNSERELLIRFCQEVQLRDPDLLIGWNFIRFDIRVLQAAADRLKLSLNLGRDGSKLRFSDGIRNGEQRYPDKVYIAGRIALDGIEVMKNATYHFQSFSLNYVASEVLGETKLINESTTTNKLAEIKHQYKYKPIELAEYNLQDCKLVTKIFNREKLFEYLITRTELTGLELDRVGGSVAAFTNLYLPHVHRNGWIAPNLVKPENYIHSPGGFVMDSQPGIHENVLVFDFKSLYPSIIRTFNVDPVGLLEARGLPDEEVIEGFRGGRFSRRTGSLTKILDKLWFAREEAKKNDNQVFSNAIKIIMNSFYGVLGSSGCRFYDTKLASSITMRGHWILNQSKDWFEQKGLNVIYGDTDSIFVCLDGSDLSADAAKGLETELNKWWQDKLARDFALECKLEMEFETHFSPFFMPTIRGSDSGSKKRYAGMKINNGEKSLVFKGLESVRSDWTELAKQFQTELYLRIFEGKDIEQFVLDTISSLKAGNLDNLLVYKKKLRRPLEAYTKTTPPHIKAARADTQKKYHKGSSIQYVISVNGPVVISEDNYVIDYQHYIDKQLMPIAESILSFAGLDSDIFFSNQMSLI